VLTHPLAEFLTRSSVLVRDVSPRSLTFGICWKLKNRFAPCSEAAHAGFVSDSEGGSFCGLVSFACLNNRHALSQLPKRRRTTLASFLRAIHELDDQGSLFRPRPETIVAWISSPATRAQPLRGTPNSDISDHQMTSQAPLPGPRRTALPTRPSREHFDVSKRLRQEPAQPGDEYRTSLEAGTPPSSTQAADGGQGLSPQPGSASPASLPAEAVHDGASTYRELSVETTSSQGQSGQVCRLELPSLIVTYVSNLSPATAGRLEHLCGEGHRRAPRSAMHAVSTSRRETRLALPTSSDHQVLLLPVLDRALGTGHPQNQTRHQHQTPKGLRMLPRTRPRRGRVRAEGNATGQVELRDAAAAPRTTTACRRAPASTCSGARARRLPQDLHQMVPQTIQLPPSTLAPCTFRPRTRTRLS